MLERLVHDLARAAEVVDAARPIARNKRSGEPFEPGLGPHAESDTFNLLTSAAAAASPDWYLGIEVGVPYPAAPRQKCDLRIITATGPMLVEGKLLRLKGDNGKPNDNMLMHILSPYPHHRSALTDCAKLAASTFADPKAVLIVGYTYPDMPLNPAIEAFEILARHAVRLGPRYEATFSGLCHSVHNAGSILAWQCQQLLAAK
jgi:hypothetical protein